MINDDVNDDDDENENCRPEGRSSLTFNPFNIKHSTLNTKTLNIKTKYYGKRIFPWNQ